MVTSVFCHGISEAKKMCIRDRYRIRKQSISHDKLTKKLKSHYDLFHLCDEKPALIAIWYACWNMFYGVLKKKNYEKNI